ncbi:hypothetical protein PoB_004437600 [Plakobranchus ocellatus]|uniref:Uncharacterized protein n=1 Tax=Plakobranchus ocellatus TaxID=259542 RepID=A0AAV4BBR5_9GAST|nr:hypothetical protein PoB_004437600 [Plakobranchus ocellatus]
MAERDKLFLLTSTQEEDKWLAESKRRRFCLVFDHNKVISDFQALRQARAPWWSSEPRQKDPCRCESGFAIYSTTDTEQRRRYVFVN